MEDDTTYEEDFEEDDEDDADYPPGSGLGSATSSPPRPSTAGRGGGRRLREITDLIPEIKSSGALQGNENLLLRQLIEEANPIIQAAWDVYEMDPNLEDLIDTVSHVVKLEMVRRGYAKEAPPPYQRKAEEPPEEEEDEGEDEDDVPLDFQRLLSAAVEARVLLVKDR